tara:strand:+ start:20 stop:1549 length:1530 start_codon:yes stop_codon:yes gene_type:complete
MTKKNKKKTNTSISKQSSKSISKQIYNNELYNYISLGVILIIIIYFICKEKFTNRPNKIQEPFLYDSRTRSEKASELYQLNREITDLNKAGQQMRTSIYTKFINKNIEDNDVKGQIKSYNTYYDNLQLLVKKTKPKYDTFIVKLKNFYNILSFKDSKDQANFSQDKINFRRSISNYTNGSHFTSDKITTDGTLRISNDLDVIDNKIKENEFFIDKSTTTDNNLLFNTSFFSKVKLSKPQITYDVSIIINYITIFKIFIVSDSQYTKLDINSIRNNYSSTTDIKITPDEVWKYIQDEDVNVNIEDLSKVNKISIDTDEVNEYTMINTSQFQQKIIYHITSRKDVIKKNLEENYEIYSANKQSIENRLTKFDNYGKYYKDEKEEIKTEYEKKLDTMIDNQLKDTSIVAPPETFLTYYINIDPDKLDELPYTQLRIYNKTKDKIYSEYNVIYKKYDNLILKLETKYRNFKDTIIKNQYKIDSKNAFRVLGNNKTDYFQDGIIDVGVFEFNRD